MTQVTTFNTKDVLGTDDATSVAEHIKNGDYTALEAAQAAVERIKQANPELNAMAHECFDEGILDAQRHNQGEFSGVPTVVKDNMDVKGLPTQQGSTAFTPKNAKKTDPLMRQFLAQGFTLLGKTTLPEFGFNGATEYQDGTATKNPWHIEYGAGGSSGGSSALVATGAVPIAHGNDGGGSIRIPASACGLVGLKSTRGRLIVSELAKKLPVNMISDGVVSRSVRDTANFMAAAEQFHHNPHFPPIGRVTSAGKQRLKIGLLTDTVTGEAIDPECQAAVEKTAKLLTDLGHEVEPMSIDLPSDFIDGFLIYYGFMGFATATFGKLVFNATFDAKKLDPLTHGLRKHFIKHFKDTPRSVMMYHKANQIFKEQTGHYDAVLSPVTAFPAPKLGYLSPNVPYDEMIGRLIHYAGFTAMHNVLGTPAISLPMHFTKDGQPVGIQIASHKGQEKRLLELAFELEDAQPFTHLFNQK